MENETMVMIRYPQACSRQKLSFSITTLAASRHQSWIEKFESSHKRPGESSTEFRSHHFLFWPLRGKIWIVLVGGNGEGIVVVIVKQTAFKIGKVGRGKLYTQECPLFITGFITCETKQNSSPSGCNFRLSRYLLSASITPPSCGLNWIATAR